MNKTVVIEIDVECAVPADAIQPLLQKYLEQHPFLEKISFPVFVATNHHMRWEGVRVTVRNSP